MRRHGRHEDAVGGAEDVVGERSAQALKLTGNLATAPGRQVVPTERAQTLVAYLLSMNNSYDYPEARPMPPEVEKKEGAHAAKKEGEKK